MADMLQYTSATPGQIADSQDAQVLIRIGVTEKEVADIWKILIHGRVADDNDFNWFISTDLTLGAGAISALDPNTWLALTARTAEVNFRPIPFTVAGDLNFGFTNVSGGNVTPVIRVYYTTRRMSPIAWAALRMRRSVGG